MIPKDEANQNRWELNNETSVASLMFLGDYTGISAYVSRRTKRGITLQNFYTLGSGITKIFLSSSEWEEKQKSVK